MSSIASPRAKESVRSAPSRNIDRRYHSESIPSRIVLPHDSCSRKSSTPNQDVKSKYCPAEVNKPEFSRRLGRNDSAPARRQETRDSGPTAEEVRMKDVIFLRKMLAINKKQEMMLNKRLAKLLEEDEFQILSEGRERNKHVVEQPPPTPPPPPPPPLEVQVKAETDVVELPSTTNETYVLDTNCSHKSPTAENAVIEEKISPRRIQNEATAKIIPAKKVQYDINGRRIFYYTDIDKESVEGESEQKPELDNTFNSKRVENSSKTNTKGSACSKKTFTMKKSLTYINTQGRLVKKPQVKSKRKSRKEDGDSPSGANCDNPLDFELRPKKSGCQGDGAQVQNVVVHCSTVFRNSSTSKKNIKVWNYESLPSLKSDNSLDKQKPVYSDQRLQDVSDCSKNSRSRPLSVRNNNIQIQFKSPPTRKDDRSSTVETVFLVRKKFSDAKN